MISQQSCAISEGPARRRQVLTNRVDRRPCVQARCDSGLGQDRLHLLVGVCPCRAAHF